MVMDIKELIAKEYIIEDLKSKTKREVLVELAEVFKRGDIEADYDAMIEVLLEREKLGSTGIGDGIAIPHGKLAGLEKLIISFGRSREGVGFDSLDGNPVYIFFLLMAPENSAGQHLKALAKISRMLKDRDFRKGLTEAESPEEMYNLIIEKDKTLS